MVWLPLPPRLFSSRFRCLPGCWPCPFSWLRWGSRCQHSVSPLRDPWESGARKQLVTQAELLPVVLAQELWRACFLDRRAIVFVDNDAARHALIRGGSAFGPSEQLVTMYWANEARSGAFSEQPGEHAGNASTRCGGRGLVFARRRRCSGCHASGFLSVGKFRVDADAEPTVPPIKVKRKVYGQRS